MKKRILIYTDCDSFAGCENMPVSIYNFFLTPRRLRSIMRIGTVKGMPH